MKLLFFTEARLWRDGRNRHFFDNESFSGRMFQRYLKEFDHVYIVARAFNLPQELTDKVISVEDAGVSVLDLPAYIGPLGYLKKKPQLYSAIKHYIDSHPFTASICRVPGLIGNLASKHLIRSGRPYGVEVVGDPNDVFSPGAYKHPMRAIFRYIGSKSLVVTVRGAATSLYVTRSALQRKYPPAMNTFTTYASNVMLPQEAFVRAPKKFTPHPPFKIVAVGTLAALYKGPDVLIDAISRLDKKVFTVSVQWLGDGQHKEDMIQNTALKGLNDRIKFIGSVGSAQQVRKYLDHSDLFVLPSRQEGLPRALVEAMARGLPCIGTQVGGIPELLDPIALVPVNNPQLLSKKMHEFLTTPEVADAQAARNLTESRNYVSAVLDAKRSVFYEHLKKVTTSKHMRV